MPRPPAQAVEHFWPFLTLEVAELASTCREQRRQLEQKREAMRHSSKARDEMDSVAFEQYMVRVRAAGRPSPLVLQPRRPPHPRPPLPPPPPRRSSWSGKSSFFPSTCAFGSGRCVRGWAVSLEAWVGTAGMGRTTAHRLTVAPMHALHARACRCPPVPPLDLDTHLCPPPLPRRSTRGTCTWRRRPLHGQHCPPQKVTSWRHSAPRAAG